MFNWSPHFFTSFSMPARIPTDLYENSTAAEIRFQLVPKYQKWNWFQIFLSEINKLTKNESQCMFFLNFVLLKSLRQYVQCVVSDMLVFHGRRIGESGKRIVLAMTIFTFLKNIETIFTFLKNIETNTFHYQRGLDPRLLLLWLVFPKKLKYNHLKRHSSDFYWSVIFRSHGWTMDRVFLGCWEFKIPFVPPCWLMCLCVTNITGYVLWDLKLD